MNRRAAVVTAAAVLCSMVLTGCGGTNATEVFPERPYLLDVDHVDPCSALTSQQVVELGLRTGSGGTAQGGTSHACTWPGRDGVGVTFQTLGVDAEVAIGAEPTSTVVTVAGFGAVQSSPPAQGTGLPFCQVVLDVADGNALRAQVQGTPLAPDAEDRTIDGTCEEVRRVAELMLRNLRTQQPA